MAIKPRTMAQRKAKNANGFQSYEFVNMSLNSAQGKQFREWYAQEAAGWHDDLAGMVLSGYKVSATWNDQNQCYIATLTCNEETDPNYGYCLSSRADNVWEALAMCVFKTFELCTDQEWPKTAPQNSFG